MQVFFEQYLDNLKCMDLRYSKDLIETPDFRGVPRLERLHLSWCNNLVEIHPSIGQLSRLIILDLEYCVSLIDLPSMSSEMESLKILKLCGCSKIGKIPEFKGIMRSQSELHLDKTTIEKLPSSIECLTALTLLSLRDCQYLTCLPRNKDSLRSLEKLVVIGCSKLTHLPGHLWNIKCLERDLSKTAFRQPLDRNFHVRRRSLSPTLSRFSRRQWIPQCTTNQQRQLTPELHMVLQRLPPKLLSELQQRIVSPKFPFHITYITAEKLYFPRSITSSLITYN